MTKTEKQTKEVYYKVSNYLKSRFGERVYKIGVDAGFSCPNRDGKISKEGCIFCDNRTFSFNTRTLKKTVKNQIEEGIKFGKTRFDSNKFIVYFQAYTNTYAPVNVLKSIYDTVREFENVAGIAIGTRPDCINTEILDLVDSYTQDYEVWVEYGMPSIHSQTLEFVNRGHFYNEFLEAIALTKKKKNIKICVHVIVGLPFETRSMIVKTAKALGLLKVDGIKINPLYIIKGTKLEEIFKRGSYKPLEFMEYMNLVAEFLEYLWPGTVVQRITADCSKEFLVAPLWILDRNNVIEEIELNLWHKEVFQGRLYKEE